MKKIIYISHWRFPSEKALSPFAMKSCETFARSGLEVELWIPKRRKHTLAAVDPFSYHQIERNFFVRRLPVLDLMRLIPGNISFYILLFTFNFSLVFYMFWRRLSPDTIFYFHDARDAAFLLFFRKFSFLEIHDFYKSRLRVINKWCFSRVLGFIVTNRFKMDFLQKEFKVGQERMLHQPNAVDERLFNVGLSKKEARQKLGLMQDTKIILYAGSLFLWKGVDTLLQASGLLDKGCLVYFVGGTDEDINRFKAEGEKLKAKNAVIAGRKPHAEIPLWLKAADVLVLPNTGRDQASKYETSPLKLFEYMASGQPIIVSDLPSVRNIVDERTAWFFEPDNPAALAETIKVVLTRPDESHTKSTAARQEVKKYSWEKRAHNIIEFIEKSLG